MPMLTISEKLAPVLDRILPPRTASAKLEHALALGAHQRIDVFSRPRSAAQRGRIRRSAVCSTARPSVRVDGIAAKHRLDAVSQPQLISKCGEVPDNVARDALT